jgi:hypothetical protein
MRRQTFRPPLPHPPGSADIGFGVSVGGCAQDSRDLGGGPRPLPELVHNVVDSRPKSVTAGYVRTARGGTVEHQPGQMRSHGALDDVGDRFVLARDGMQRRDVDTGSLRLSHTR